MTQLIQRIIAAEVQEYLMHQGLSEFEAALYAARGIGNIAELNHDFTHLLPFHQLKNMDAAVQLLYQAIKAQEKILIIADYDADGATGCAVAVKGLHSLGAKVDFLIPNRFEEGYGLTPEIVAQAIKKSPQLIVTVDNGIASVEGVACANAHKIKVLITDHHLPGPILPEAIIVNPNQPGCHFASKNLAGVGVIFYVLLALRAYMRKIGHFTQCVEPSLANLLELVALGTVADVVPLDHNNRILIAQGLKRIRGGRAAPGIMALFAVSKRDPRWATVFDLGFAIAPRLNAAGRLQDMSLGVMCLLDTDSTAALYFAQKLDQLNQDRRYIEAEMQEAAQQILNSIPEPIQYSVSLFHPDWHQGVVGIVASKIKERYHRPCFVFAQGKSGEIKGSGRSINGLHLRDALDLLNKEVPGLLQRFGGHAMAAGVSILAQDFLKFSTAFEKLCVRLINQEAFHKTLYIDGTPPREIYSLAQVEKLESQIWGQGFAPPLFIDKFEVLSQRIVGGKHLKLKLKNGYGQLIEGIYFQSTVLLPSVFSGVFQLVCNRFQQQQSIQLIFQHICIA